jgi:hypothetical protein
MKYVNVPCIILGLFVLISHQSVVFFSLNKSTTHQHYFSAPAKPTGRLSLAHFFFVLAMSLFLILPGKGW